MMDISAGAAKTNTGSVSSFPNASASAPNQSGSSGTSLHQQQTMDTTSSALPNQRSDGRRGKFACNFKTHFHFHSRGHKADQGTVSERGQHALKKKSVTISDFQLTRVFNPNSNANEGPAKKVPDVSDLPYNISKSRTIRFHKLFKSTPIEEYPLESFSCAFKGDILLHGQLYVSHHWACFYSKIKARGRLIEIPFDKIISITREKLALIIPNAIGIQTADQKYVFGSFISRDSTYKKLVTLWKLNQDSTSGTPGLSIELGGSVIGQPTSEDSSESDTTEDDLNADQQLDRLKRVGASGNQGHRRTLVEVDHGIGGGSGKHGDKSGPAGGFGTRHAASSQCLNCKSVASSFSTFSVKLQKIPQTNLLLAVCTVLVFFLLLSAMGLTYKILLLQSKLEIRNVWSPQASLSFRERAMSNLYWLQTESHASVVRQLHTVLEANIHLLEEVHTLLQSLYRDPDSNVSVKESK